jgi:hypothetical protein
VRELRAWFDPVLVILSPPRCASTAVARAFWQHPWFGWYLHEPFDRVYHDNADRAEVLRALADPLGLAPLREPTSSEGKGVIVKEMTFQPGALLPELLAASTLPVVLTIRDPRLAIRSRMRQRGRGGQPEQFPPVESGWLDLLTAVSCARSIGRPYVLVETTRLRADPVAYLPALCARVGVPYTERMLSWRPATGVSLGQLGDSQRHWYEQVLDSDGVAPPNDELPELTEFGGMRAHVETCLDVYREVLNDPRLLTTQPRLDGEE